MCFAKLQEKLVRCALECKRRGQNYCLNTVTELDYVTDPTEQSPFGETRISVASIRDSQILLNATFHVLLTVHPCTSIYRVSQEEWTKLREGVPYVELYRYNPDHLYPKLNGYGDNDQRSLKL